MKTRVFAGVFAVGFAVLAVACGTSSDGGDVPSNSVAVVGDRAITKAEFDDLVKYAKRSYVAQKRPFPKVGTQEYAQIRDQAVRFLVQRAQFEVKASDLGVNVSDEDVNKRVDQYKRIYNKVTGEAKVTDKEIQDHYAKNKAQYGTPETRVVRHVLVKDKATADRLYNELRAGGDWSAIAKRYSQDPASKNQGGRMTATKGALVPEFEQAAFSIGNNGITKPVKTQYGWHIIQALSPVKQSTTTPLNQVKEAIRQQLTQDKKNKEMQGWVEEMRKDLDGETAYQVGYKPTSPETPAAG